MVPRAVEGRVSLELRRNGQGNDWDEQVERRTDGNMPNYRRFNVNRQVAHVSLLSERQRSSVCRLGFFRIGSKGPNERTERGSRVAGNHQQHSDQRRNECG